MKTLKRLYLELVENVGLEAKRWDFHPNIHYVNIVQIRPVHFRFVTNLLIHISTVAVHFLYQYDPWLTKYSDRTAVNQDAVGQCAHEVDNI